MGGGARWSENEFKDKVLFAKFDVDQLPELAQQLGVRAMPSFFIYKDGEKVDELVGANPTVLADLVRKHTE